MRAKRFTAILLAAAVVLSLTGCSVLPGGNCMKSGKITVTDEMYSYFLNSRYRSFVDEYADYVELSGLDTAKDPGEQTRSDGSTWKEYMNSLTTSHLTETLALLNGAAEEKITLSEEGKAAVTQTMSGYEEDGTAVRMSLDEYLPWAYGEGVSRDTVERCLEMEELAAQYKKHLEENMIVTEADCESYFEQSPEALLRCDYVKITVPKDRVEKLMSAYDRSSFLSIVRDTITELNFGGNYTKFAETIDRLVEDKITVGEEYIPGSDISEWAFEKGRRAFDIHTKEQSSGDVTVTMVLSAADRECPYSEVLYRNEEKLKSIEYICFEDEAEAKSIVEKYADSVTKEVFEDLRDRYSVKTIENTDRAGCIEALRSWAFSADTKEGDACAVLYDGKGYIALCVEVGGEAWLNEARELAAGKTLSDRITELKAQFPVKVNDAKIEKVKLNTLGHQ